MADVGEGEIVGALYDAAMGNRSWNEVGHRLMTLAGGQSLILLVHEPLELIVTQNLPDEALRTYAAHYAPMDVWTLGMEKKQLTNRPVLGAELIDYRSLENTEFYCDFLKPRVPMYHVACSLLTLGKDSRAGLGIHRPRDAGAFEQPDVALMARLLGHVRTSLDLRRRLRIAGETAAFAFAALDRLSTAVVLLAPGGGVLHANSAAEAILRGRDGLTAGPNGLHAAIPEDDRRLQKVIAGARATTFNSAVGQAGGGRVRINRPSGRRAYALTVMPVGRHLSTPGVPKPAVIVFIADSAVRPPLNPRVLEVQFGLSPAEAKLVVALASGTSLPQYAQEACISYHTARTLLARALTRTETGSQLELVSLVLTSQAGIGNE
ncbi:MAG: helix-turn-helix transcriptional regulator [Enhydrobacter sp.]|nr:helix-turn-helix transcriptional regulator [Enhydrobacter sp.]